VLPRHDLLDETATSDMLTGRGTGGFRIDASVRIEGYDRHGLERLVRGHRRGALPLLCPSCGGPMRILAFLTDPPVVRSILMHLDLPHRPPPLAPTRGPPQGDFILDQSLGVDVLEAEPAPAFAFDQSAPEFDFDQSLPDTFED
jgi:hypothetical protein